MKYKEYLNKCFWNVALDDTFPISAKSVFLNSIKDLIAKDNKYEMGLSGINDSIKFMSQNLETMRKRLEELR